MRRHWWGMPSESGPRQPMGYIFVYAQSSLKLLKPCVAIDRYTFLAPPQLYTLVSKYSPHTWSLAGPRTGDRCGAGIFDSWMSETLILLSTLKAAWNIESGTRYCSIKHWSKYSNSISQIIIELCLVTICKINRVFVDVELCLEVCGVCFSIQDILINLVASCTPL